MKEVQQVVGVRPTQMPDGGQMFEIFLVFTDGSRARVLAKKQDRWSVGDKVECTGRGRNFPGPDGTEWEWCSLNGLKRDGTPFNNSGPRGGAFQTSAPAAAPARQAIPFAEAATLVSEIIGACPDPTVANYLIPAVLAGDVARPQAAVQTAPAVQAPMAAAPVAQAAPASTDAGGFFDGL